MAKAYDLALKAQEQGEVPVGAVLVSAEGELLGEGSNRVIQSHDPSAHAEMIALRVAGLTRQNYRLLNTTLYVTLEPCIMCAGALVHARVKRLVFATRDEKTGAAGSVFDVLKGFPLNHAVCMDEGVMQKECARLLKNFFKNRR